MQFLSKEDYAKAGIEFKNALQIKKDLVGAWRGLLQVELHNRNFQNLLPILRTIVELDPKDIDSKIRLGHQLMVNKELDQALDLVNASIALDGRNPSALALKAGLLLALKDSPGAIREAQAALDVDPHNTEALMVLAIERLARGDTDGALSVLERPGTQIKPEDEFVIQLLKLQILEKAGDWKQMEVLLRKMIDLYPFEAAFQRNLINLYVKQQRYDDAERELRALSAAKPSDAAAGMDVVRFLLQFKGPNAARQEVMARINAGGQVVRYQFALAELDFKQGDVADSTRLLESLIGSALSPEDKLAAQVKLAQIQFQQQKFDIAESLVSSVLHTDSRNIDGLKLRAALRLQQGRLDVAIADLRQALDDQPRSTDLMLLLATAYERNGSIELAEKEYADATRISDFNVGVSLNYVAFLQRRGNIEHAEDVLIQLTQRWPNNVAVLSALADVRLARQNWIGAQEVAEAIKRIGKTQGLGDQVLAAALSGQGKYSDSIRILEGLQSAAPAAVQPMAALVNTLVRAQKLDEAVSFLQAALKTNPANAEAHVLLGFVQLLKHEPDQAIQSFKTAIERQPKDMVGYNALADFYARNRNLDEAEKVIRAGLQQQPDSFAMHLKYANLLEAKGDHEAAIAEYEGLLKQDPGSLIAANNLASLLSDRRADKASLERAYSLAATLRKSQIPAFKDTLGWIDYLRGDYKSATGLLEEAAAALPDRAIVQYHLGMSYVAIGLVAKAAEQFKKALALGPDSSLQEKIAAAQKKISDVN
jgi:tetratricopeptide (TPR) repeat protein